MPLGLVRVKTTKVEDTASSFTLMPVEPVEGALLARLAKWCRM